MTARPHAENRRILAVDDDPLILALHRHLFKQQSAPANELLSMGQDQPAPLSEYFELECFSQGEEAVEAVESALRNDQPYAVALVDMRMPPGIDGLETAKRIRALDRNIHIIFVTAYSDHELGELTRKIAAPVQLQQKPIDRPVLKAVVEQALAEFNAQAAP